MRVSALLPAVLALTVAYAAHAAEAMSLEFLEFLELFDESGEQDGMVELLIEAEGAPDAGAPEAGADKDE